MGAAAAGCRAIASGAAPLVGGVPVPVTHNPRNLALHAHSGRLVDEQLVNGMHVHVAMPDRAAGVAVLNRVRLWLPLLVAMAGNSPLWRGQDTGFASWRTVIFGRWPVSGLPPHFADDADYDRRVDGLIRTGAISDVAQVYWQARLSHRYPTLEVRCFDVQLRADEAAMFAGVVRALAATALKEEAAGVPVPHCLPEVLYAASWHAARHGLDGRLIDAEGRQQPAGDLLCAMVDHISPALEESGDLREVTSLLHRFLQHGTPADRQRQALAAGGFEALTELITVAGGTD
ncbi:carboxylate-amine ligase [Streptomyces cinnamoneus]|uniref:carboxylate-amine ligase n=1 Tax=Streptomyces cinnamoneus TaxID=53446 RepID=UPI003799A396